MRATYRIPAGNLGALRSKVEDLAKRAARLAAKHGLDYSPISLTEGERVVEDVDGEKRVYVLVTVDGSVPRVAGWEFVAALQHEEGGTILRSVPTAELAPEELARYRQAPPACEHCGLDRKRGDTFVLRCERHAEGCPAIETTLPCDSACERGGLKQVGRSCLQQFIGHRGPEHLAAMAEILATVGDVCESFGGWGGGENVADLLDYLGFVAAAIRLEGWTSRTVARDRMTQATADRAWGSRFPPRGTPREYVLQPEPRDRELAAAALAWGEALEPTTDYEHNLAVVVRGGVVTHRLAGFAASLVPAYERAMGRELTRKRARSAGHVGVVGERSEFELELANVYSVDTMYGVTHIHKFVSPEGAVVVWKTGTARLDQGKKYRVRGTVSKHGEYRGEPQTELKRCKAEEVR